MNKTDNAVFDILKYLDLDLETKLKLREFLSQTGKWKFDEIVRNTSHNENFWHFQYNDDWDDFVYELDYELTDDYLKENKLLTKKKKYSRVRK